MKKILCLMLCVLLAVAGLVTANAEAPVQELTYALANEPDGIDPGVTNNSFASPILNNVFEGLVDYSSEDGALIPGEAESWEISEDGLTYTFTLRDGLKWSDGSDHTAADYVYSMKRILDPNTEAKYVDFLLDYVEGAAEYYEDNSIDFDTVKQDIFNCLYGMGVESLSWKRSGSRISIDLSYYDEFRMVTTRQQVVAYLDECRLARKDHLRVYCTAELYEELSKDNATAFFTLLRQAGVSEKQVYHNDNSRVMIAEEIKW